MRGDRHGRDLLHGKGQTNGKDRSRGARGGERPVVVTLAVADAAAATIEGGERHEKDVWRDLGNVLARLAQAETTGNQGLTGPPGAEAEKGVVDDREGEARAARREGQHERAWVDLGSDRPETSDTRGTHDSVERQGAIRDGARGMGTERRIERVAPGQSRGTQLRLG